MPTADVVVLGDVLEHLTYLDAVALRRGTRAAAYLSLLIVAYPQGAVEGNWRCTTCRTSCSPWKPPLTAKI
jgi:hypothetical protein